MKMYREKVAALKKRVEENRQGKIISTEIHGQGKQCPHCCSMNLEHNNKYPRFRKKTFFKKTVVIFMTKCLTCGTLFDKPEILKDPWVIFRLVKGYEAYNLKETTT